MKRKVKPIITILLIVSMLMSNIAMIATYAETASYPVELAFNNIFVFEKWANNSLSSTEIIDGVPTADKTKDGLEFNIANGSFTFTKSNMAAGEAYTAFSMGTEKATDNSSYYMMSVKPSTTYTFSYKLEGNVNSFKPFIFFYDEDGLFTGIENMVSYTTPGNGYHSFEFNTAADVAAIQIRFTIGDNSTTRPGVTSVSANVSEIAIYETELFRTNLFDFNGWANNKNSSLETGAKGEYAGGTYDYTGGSVSAEKGNKSITITTNDTQPLFFTNFSLSTDPDETQEFYMIDVEPNTMYSFSYYFQLNNVNRNVFEIWISMYDEDGKFINFFCEKTTGVGYNSFDFLTYHNAYYIQISFASEHSSEVGIIGTFKNITLYKIANNLFDFNGWADNSKSATTPDSTAGSFTVTETSSIEFKTAPTADVYLWTGFGIDTTASNDAYYTIDVQSNTSYTLTYDIGDSTLPGPVHCQPYIVEMDSDGKCITYYNYETPQLTGNKREFTTQANTERIQVVFAVINNSEAISRTCTVTNIGVYETDVLNADFEYFTSYPHRKAYTYGTGATYGDSGDLPVPANIPAGKVFAGWYTGPNGTGERIHEGTKVDYSSHTVYPKYENEATDLSIVSFPTKTVYTVGEKFNPEGLVLKATFKNSEGNEYSINISSGFFCTPEYLTSTDITAVTVKYGGKTVSVPVSVVNSINKEITVNEVKMTVPVTNNEYTLNYSTSDFNRYEMTYTSDSYVKGTITFANNVSEDFFLEPAENGSFASFIDGYLAKSVSGVITSEVRNQIAKIKFTCLDKEFGNFELYSVNTKKTDVNTTDSMRYYQNSDYKVGIDLAFGGVIAYIEDLKNKPIAAVYTDANGKKYTEVDFSSKLDTTNASATSANVNLININDKGRYLQQSYYGTDQPPFEMGNYNGIPWKYNPVQGGNIANEASKIVDFSISDTQIYIKTRPLDWGKSEEKYPDSYITPSYMEAWYVFEDGMIKSYCRFVDYSGYPSSFTDQEMPAVYPIEPLNNFVYYDGAEDNTLKNIPNPDFWGVLPSYNATLKAAGKSTVDVDVDCVENWAAFTGSEDSGSFGLGVYSAGVTDFHYGCFPAVYNEEAAKSGTLTLNDNRHAVSVNPAVESPTSYIAPVGQMTFESYKPFTYSFYISTGTAEDIRNNFKEITEKAEAEKLASTKIAVPETVYLNPENVTNGQKYVNNELTNTLDYDIVAVENDGMFFSAHYDPTKADSVEINVTNVTDSSNDISFVGTSGNSLEGTKFVLGEESGTIEYDGNCNLNLTNAIGYGETATAKWEIIFYKDDTAVATQTAYTVLYAPERTVGAVAEARKAGDINNEITSWITGINGVSHSEWSPLGFWHADKSEAGYFTQDPLWWDSQPAEGSPGSTRDYIEGKVLFPRDEGHPSTDECYVVQAATDGHDSSCSQSYLGKLTIDRSRYVTTNQIPNLKIGFEALRVAGGKPKYSLKDFNMYCTIGGSDTFASSSEYEVVSEDGWEYTGAERDIAANYDLPWRYEYPHSFVVADLDGKYLHAISQGRCQNFTSINIGGNNYEYSTACTSVFCTLTDKSSLRNAVLEGYALNKDESPAKRYAIFIEALENAATVLGTPSATQAQIDSVTDALEEAIDNFRGLFYLLKYDNLFSAYEFSKKFGSMEINNQNASIKYQDASIIVTSNATDTTDIFNGWGTADKYYNITLKRSTSYVFEYDIKSDYGSQLHLFFYDANGNLVNATNKTFKEGTNAETADNTTNGFFASLTNNIDSHIVLKFTTPADIDKIAFRFGNTVEATNKSIFSNIKLIEAEKYYAAVDYEKTESLFLEDTPYGTLQSLTGRTGFTFTGWNDVDGSAITATSTPSEHEIAYSQWREHKYTINYNANGGTGDVAATTATYTQIVTLPLSGFTKTGYTQNGWATAAGDLSATYANGATVSKLTSADNGSKTLYAFWTENSYNIKFVSNLYGVADPPAIESRLYTAAVEMPTLEKLGYTFKGWSLSKNGDAEYTPGAIVRQLCSNLNETITLYGIWSANRYNITFDNLIDFDAWPKIAGNGVVSNVTEIGFTVTSNDGASEANSTSHLFPVTQGKQYKIDIDTIGNDWDVYIFFYDDAEPNGYGINFVDSQNKYTADGHGNQTRIFTAPTGATRAVIRVDANGSNNTVTFNNIRVYEVKVNPIDYTGMLANKYATYDSEYPNGAPVLSRKGYDFLGWYDNSNDRYYSGSSSVIATLFQFTQTLNLVSKWQLNNDSLEEDTFVVDFGAPISFDPVANDTIFKNEVAYSDATYELSVNTLGASVSDAKVNFKPSRVINSVMEIPYFAKLGNEPKLENKINVIPASNVLYEEDVITASGSGKEWTSESESIIGTSTEQSLSSESDIYGYDEIYDGKTGKYSDNSAYKATVDSSNRTSQKLTFEFTGTGFELYGACGQNTGIQVINIKKDGKTVKAAVVDTYYNDSTYETLYQTPIYNVSGLEYGNYTVEITAAYLPSISGALKQDTLDGEGSDSYNLADALADVGLDYILEADDVDVEWFDDDSILNGGTGANDPTAFGTYADMPLENYVDAVRVFEPLNKDDSRYIDSEKNVRYYNIVDNLLTDNFFGEKPGFVYVEGSNGVFDAETYSKKGANHEVLLANTQNANEAITFKVEGYDENSRVMLSLRTAYGNPVVKIGDKTVTVNSTTEMYYDITENVASDGTVTIQNVSTDKSLLSVGYLKLTGQTILESTSDLSTAIDMIETPIDTEDTESGSIIKVEYTPSTDSHNSFDVTVNGRPAMIQFIEEDGGTRTYDRNNKNVVIKSYNADGVEVNSLDRTVAYEVWTINTNLTGPDVKARAKYLADGAYTWEKNHYSFTYEILEPEIDAEVKSITPASQSGPKGPVSVKVVTGPDAQGVRFVMPDGSTATYYTQKAAVLEDGNLEFIGKAWMNNEGLNTVTVKVRVNGAWVDAGTIEYTVE